MVNNSEYGQRRASACRLFPFKKNCFSNKKKAEGQVSKTIHSHLEPIRNSIKFKNVVKFSLNGLLADVENSGSLNHTNVNMIICGIFIVDNDNKR